MAPWLGLVDLPSCADCVKISASEFVVGGVRGWGGGGV